jgi:hypothetical protein
MCSERSSEMENVLSPKPANLIFQVIQHRCDLSMSVFLSGP